MVVQSVWFCEPKIILKNTSKYKVYFNVLQENRLKIMAARERVQKETGASLDIAGNGIGRLGAKALQKSDITKELGGDQHFLAKALRVDSVGSSVDFPRACKELRVFGFFRTDSSEAWTCFKNKVYSIGRRKKIFTLTATDERIEMFLT